MRKNSQAVVFSSGKDDWQTPLDAFLALDKIFRFTIDVAATEHNSLCREWIGPGSVLGDDALIVPWVSGLAPDFCWCNPPYSRVKDFVAKAAAERLRGVTTVMLIPSRTDTRWWHEHIWDRTKHMTQPGVEIRFLKGRVKFVNPTGDLRQGHTPNSAPFPSVVIVFRGLRG